MHAAWVVLLCATARAARVATPTKDDRIQANADAAGTQRIFTEQCLRDRSQTTCEDHWARWVDMRARDLVRRRSYHEPVVMAPSLSSNDVPVSYDHVPCGETLDPITTCDEAVVALGIVSAATNQAHRHAIRETWLREPNKHGVAYRFFLGIPSSGLVPAAEMSLYRDIHIVNITESYKATWHKVRAIFHWGANTCGAWYVLRANDDVYLRLEATVTGLFKAGPPSRVYAGLFVDPSTMHVPRLDTIPQAPPGISDDDWTRANKAWVVSRAAYPADTYPSFAQGNAYILSRDLARHVATMTSSRPLPDDVEVGLLIDSVTGGNFVRVDVAADYATEGRWSPCRPESAWHFNLHPEHMYDLHSAEPDVTWYEYGFEVDGGRVLLGWDDEEDLDAFASVVASDHGLVGEGCHGDGSDTCAGGRLASALRAAPVVSSPDRCSRVPEGVFCCG